MYCHETLTKSPIPSAIFYFYKCATMAYMKKGDKIIIGVAGFSLALSVFALWGYYDMRREGGAVKEAPLLTDTVNSGVSPDGADVLLPYPQPLTIQEIRMPAGTMPGFDYSPPSATTSQIIGRGGVSDMSAQTASDVIIAYGGDVLIYHNTTIGFEFGLPSVEKKLRLNDTGSYARKSDALVWLWFTKGFDIATANFFVTPTAVSSVSELSFDYNFIGYPSYMGTLSSVVITVNGTPALEETVSYESASPGYPNTWKFIHILHDGKLYTFGAQIAPVQAINEKEVEQMITVFKGTFHFLP